MKRFAVFNCPQYYPSGGMGDFIGAFDTKEGAELYIQRSFDCDLFVEDMHEALSRPSPHIPTEEEFKLEVKNRRTAREEWLKDPLNKAVSDACKQMERDLYADSPFEKIKGLEGIVPLEYKK